jgi:hypothetical protein
VTANPERILIDSWTLETESGSRSTEVYSDGKSTLVIREFVKEGRSQVTAIPFAHGEDLQRLITALQSAGAYTGKRA